MIFKYINILKNKKLQLSRAEEFTIFINERIYL